MTDLQTARAHLEGHSLCLCKNGAFFTDDGRGISPMVRLLAEGRDLRGYAAADVIVGKAAAMLFLQAGVAAVHGNVMSVAARGLLQQHGVFCTYDVLTEQIINRKGDGACPMETLIAQTDDVDEGCRILSRAVLY